ncbi:uncharacterized protein V1516DRAFT_624548 [Lipomyces oligophaga]|uniref:uncharacterized protein n=1 Tax=Lipomyces oligophaga TaxID=45792 RepID=UPI0034CF16B7
MGKSAKKEDKKSKALAAKPGAGIEKTTSKKDGKLQKAATAAAAVAAKLAEKAKAKVTEAKKAKKETIAEKKQTKSKKTAKKVESESESDSDSDSEEVEKMDVDSSDSESESDSDSESESDSDSESESDSDSDSESESEKKKVPSKTNGAATKKQESDSDSSDSDSDSDSEEEEKVAPKAASKKLKTDETDGESKTLFVGRLSWNVDDEWLYREFEPIGKVVSARIVTDKASGRSKGFGYVDFEDSESANKALEKFQGKEIDGRPVNLDLSTQRPDNSNNRSNRAEQYGDKVSEPSDTLFLGNLSFNVERDELFELFGAHGNVINVRLPTNPETEQLKGFGYVQFSSIDEAKSALDALNGASIAGRSVRLDFSTPRDNNASGRGGRGGSRGGRGGRGGSRGGPGGRGGRGGRGGFASGSNAGPRGRMGAAPFQGKKTTF